MTRDELKTRLSSVVLNHDLSEEDRQRTLLPIAQEFIGASVGDDASMDQSMDTWNNVMAEIAEENGLGRH